jgi:hypothetical protein
MNFNFDFDFDFKQKGAISVHQINTFGLEGNFSSIQFNSIEIQFLNILLFSLINTKRTQVSICISFCNQIYEECQDAEYGGSTIKKEYSNGEAFCRAQDFNIINSNRQCFKFDPNPFSGATTTFSLTRNQFYTFYLFLYFIFKFF